ncbi:MAG: hypothetical protein ACYDGS_01530 [Thermoleophilia bacterium]
MLIALFPLRTADLTSNPDPATSYEEAARRVQAIFADETADVAVGLGDKSEWIYPILVNLIESN